MNKENFEPYTTLPGPSKEGKSSNQNYYFNEEYIDEFDAFTKYYNNIRSTGYVSKILRELDNMREHCDLFDKVSREYEYQDLDLYYEETTDTTLNDNILYATDDVELWITGDKGRHLVATKHISTSTVLISEMPTVLQVTPMCMCIGNTSTSLYRCHHCGIGCYRFYTCQECNVCIFCSRTCLNIAYQEYHVYECYGVQRHFWSINENTDYSYLSLRMMLYGASCRFKTHLSAYYGSVENNYAGVFGLQTHFDKMSRSQIDKILYSSARNLLYLINKSHFFSNYENIQNIDNFILYVGGLLVKHYCQAQVNNILLTFPHLHLSCGLHTPSGSGKAICPTIALINHSCTPNATIITCANFIIVKTIRPIKQGEEITLHYSEVPCFSSLNDRRLVTQQFLFFTCHCSLCQFEASSLQDPYKCQFCQITTIKQIKQIEQRDSQYKGRCPKCGNVFSMSSVIRQMKQVAKHKKLYSTTKSIAHLTKIEEIYKNLFLQNSIQLLDIYQVLYQSYRSLEDCPMQILKYGLLIFEILEHRFGRLFLPLIVGKFIFFLRMSNLKITEVKEKDYEILKKFIKEVPKLKSDLLFYITADKLSFYLDIQTKILILSHSIKIIKDSNERDI